MNHSRKYCNGNTADYTDSWVVRGHDVIILLPRSSTQHVRRHDSALIRKSIKENFERLIPGILQDMTKGTASECNFIALTVYPCSITTSMVSGVLCMNVLIR